MKLKILAVVALGAVGVAAVVVRDGRPLRPSAASDDPTT